MAKKKVYQFKREDHKREERRKRGNMTRSNTTRRTGTKQNTKGRNKEKVVKHQKNPDILSYKGFEGVAGVSRAMQGRRKWVVIKAR